MRILLIISFLSFTLELSAQVSHPMSIPKTVKVDFGNQKSSYGQPSEDKKARKDSLQAAKKRYRKLQKQAKLSGDSLRNEVKNAIQDSLNRLKREYIPYDSSYLDGYKNQLPDSSYLDQYKGQIPDSTSIENYKQQGINRGKQVIESTPEAQRAKQIQSEIGELPNDPDEASQLIEEKAEQYAEQYTQQLTKQQLLEQKYRKIIEEKRAIVKAEKLQRRYEMMKAYADKDKLKQQAEQELKKVASDYLQ
jgi:hypothetical protein